MSLIAFISIFTVCNLFTGVIAAESDSKIKPAAITWISGELPGNFSIEGDWIWSDEVTHGKVKVHEEGITKGIESHLFRTDSIVKLNQDSKVIQYVNVDPENMPLGIMLKFFLKLDKEVSLYWEEKEEAFVELDEYITAWYMGFIPEPGKWTGLEFDCKELDIKDAELVGMEFIVNSGRAWWGETVIINKEAE
jgi:hypothetical protein